MQYLLGLLDQLIAANHEGDALGLVQAIRETISTQFAGRIPSELFACAERECRDGYATWDEFLTRLLKKRKAMWGYQSAYVRASESLNPVTNETVQFWRICGQVPRLYVDQIDAMTFPSRSRPHGQNWTAIEIDFLVERHHEDPAITNKDLAHRCSERFRREITESSVKGQLDRLRRVGRVPRYRARHEREIA